MAGFTSGLYRVARLMRDANAIRRGPEAVLKRQVRKSAHKGLARLLARILR